MALKTNNNSFFSRHRLLVWLGSTAVAVLILASFMTRDDSIPVRAAQVVRGTVRSVISTNGKIEPAQNFEARTPIGTTVKKILVKEGDHVRKGQLLVQLDDAEARSQAARALAQVRASDVDVTALRTGGTREEVLTIQSQLTKARTEQSAAQRNLEALRRLQQSGAASPSEVTAAEGQSQRANADVRLLQQKLKDRFSKPEISRVQAQSAEARASYGAAQDVLSKLNVRAPFEGTVYSLPVREGNYVNPGDLVLQAADLSKVVVRAFVDEPDVGRLSPGEKIEITWDALPGRVWEGSLGSVPATLKLRGTRNVGETTCVVDNRDLKLLPSVNVGVTIIAAEHHNVLTVPREAIRQDNNKPYVYQIVNGRLQRRYIQISIANLTSVEVDGGLDGNALVALGSTNSKPLKEGLAAKVVQ